MPAGSSGIDASASPSALAPLLDSAQLDSSRVHSSPDELTRTTPTHGSFRLDTFAFPSVPLVAKPIEVESTAAGGGARAVVVGLSPGRIWLVRGLPILAGTLWLVTLTALLVIWGTLDDFKRYKADMASITYLSHVGGAHPAVFLPGCILTAFAWYAAYAAERMLRYEHLLMMYPGESLTRRRWLVAGWVDLFCASAGAASLILVGAFNAFTADVAHDAMTALFAILLTASGVIQIEEIRLLFRHHPAFHALRTSARVKVGLLVPTVLCLVLFEALVAVCPDAEVSPTCWRASEGSAVSEWIACYLGAFYLFSLAWDVWPLERYRPTAAVGAGLLSGGPEDGE